MALKRSFAVIGLVGLLVWCLVYYLSTYISDKNQGQFVAPPFRNISIQPVDGTTLIILRWTSFFGDKDPLGSGRMTCPSTDGAQVYSCHFTDDRRLLDNAEVISFILGKTTLRNLPSMRKSWQKWLMFNKESPVFGNVLKGPLSLFNITTYFHRDSTLMYPYGHCKPLGSTEPPGVRGTPFLAQYEKVSRRETKQMSLSKALNMTHLMHRKPVAWFVSKCKTHSKREDYVEILKQYIQIDIYGYCGPLECEKQITSKSWYCYQDVLDKNYMFYLSFENSLCDDYLTEKVFNILTLQLNVIPIVLGFPKYEEFLPPRSYINVRDFKSPEHLANYLKILMQNETMYSEYFEWRKNYQCLREDPEFSCKLCRYLHENRYRTEISSDITKFWSRNKRCHFKEQYYKGIM